MAGGGAPASALVFAFGGVAEAGAAAQASALTLQALDEQGARPARAQTLVCAATRKVSTLSILAAERTVPLHSQGRPDSATRSTCR